MSLRPLAWALALLPALTPAGRGHPERRVSPIALTGPLSSAEAEISGLSWRGDDLVILPQYPDRFGDALFVVSRDELERSLSGGGPLDPRPIPLLAPGLVDAIPGYEGLEAIAFDADRVYVTVEASVDGRTLGYLIDGSAAADLSSVSLDVEGRVELEPQAPLENMAYEALVVLGDRVVVFYEDNGANNPTPRALSFDRSLRGRVDLPLDPLEYRLTDATAPDDAGRFWVTNYFWPGTPYPPGECALSRRYGRGPTHRRSAAVERLVEVRVSGDRVRLTGTPPIELELLGGEASRNWEGLARLAGRGFLVATDRHPRSMLALVPDP